MVDTSNYYGAFDRLITVARSDTGQSRRVADFILACWNAGRCGKWDPAELWDLDQILRDDILTILIEMSKPGNSGTYPTERREEIELLRLRWRRRKLRKRG